MLPEAAPTVPPPTLATLRSVAGENKGKFAQSVLEGLQSVVPEPVAKVVLESALALAGRSVVPENAMQASEFIQGPLLTSLSTTLEGQGAHTFLERMQPILALATTVPGESHVRLKAKQASGPLVLFASLDPAHAQEARQQLGDRARVDSANNVLDLLLRINNAHRDDEIALVIDGVEPPIETVALASMIPERTTLKVILWRVDKGQREDIDASRPQDQSWLASGDNAELKHVIELLSAHL